MDEDEKKPTTIPLLKDLLHDMVYDPSLPLRPPKKPRRPKAENGQKTPPGYDPDTIDLFGDVDPPVSMDDLDEEIIEEARDQLIDDLIEESGEENEEISEKLRGELKDQLTQILDDLNLPHSDKSA